MFMKCNMFNQVSISNFLRQNLPMYFEMLINNFFHMQSIKVYTFLINFYTLCI